jgi:hypothetical protein
MSILLIGTEPYSSTIQPVAQTLYWLHYLSSEHKNPYSTRKEITVNSTDARTADARYMTFFHWAHLSACVQRYIQIECVAAHQSLVKQIAGPYVMGLTLLPYNELSGLWIAPSGFRLCCSYTPYSRVLINKYYIFSLEKISLCMLDWTNNSKRLSAASYTVKTTRNSQFPGIHRD